MWRLERVLPAEPYRTLSDYLSAGGGAALEAARKVTPGVLIDEIDASGLRGRGGAGFPTGQKWRTVAGYASPVVSSTVVVNAAEGEPGTFKDRAILRANPYAVLEGALIAARAVGAASVIVATKARFTTEIARLRAAVDEIAQAGWCDEVKVTIVEGPSEYLYGEETALLEVLDGRPPFPRIAPPYRRGVDEVVATDEDVDSGSGLSADVEMAGPDHETLAPPTLANNVETLANVPGIIAKGAAWFRSVGTAESPGTIVATITGAVQHDAVAEVALGSPLRGVIDELCGGARPDHSIIAVVGAASNAVLTADRLDTPLTYEAMAAAGSGLGSASFLVLDDESDPVAVAAGISRFLAIESCGQCTPCKQDGLWIADGLTRLCRGDADRTDLDGVRDRLATVADGARCNLGRQQEGVIGSLLSAFPAAFDAHLTEAASAAPSVEPWLVTELLDLTDQGALADDTFLDKQPDWTYGGEDSGRTPVERFTDHRADLPTETI